MLCPSLTEGISPLLMRWYTQDLLIPSRWQTSLIERRSGLPAPTPCSLTSSRQSLLTPSFVSSRGPRRCPYARPQQVERLPPSLSRGGRTDAAARRPGPVEPDPHPLGRR